MGTEAVFLDSMAVAMLSKLFRFIWTRCPDGYKFVNATHEVMPGVWTNKKERILRPADSPIDQNHALEKNRKVYLPLEEHTGLFRKFASLDKSEESILHFAVKYGELGEFKDCQGDDSGPRGVTNHGATVVRLDMFNGDLKRTWDDEITIMHFCVEVWDMISANDLEGLSKYFRWENRAGESVLVWNRGEEGQEFIHRPGRASKTEKEELEPRVSDSLRGATYRRGDLVGPATESILKIANARLRRVQPAIFVDWKTVKPQMKLFPTSLLEALWIQFAISVIEQKKYRQCKQCEDYFEVSKGAARINREYCSNGCRFFAYLDRKIQACTMHKEGKSYSEIAKALGSNATTVRGWVLAAKKQAEERERMNDKRKAAPKK